jgi:PPOX class probable F420-dependent enzyme
MTPPTEQEGPSPPHQPPRGEDIGVGGMLIRRPERIDTPVRGLLEAKNVVTVCTLAPDGSIHAQPTWVDMDGDHVLLNTVPRRAWVLNVEREPRVTCTVVNLENPYEFVEIRGLAEGPFREGADDHAHRLARKYLGLAEYPWLTPEAPRLLIRVVPERIVHMFPGEPELES